LATEGITNREWDKRAAMAIDSEGNCAADRPVQAVIPLAAEELAVSKQRVETGLVRVARVTHEREQTIDELLAHEMVDVSRTLVGQVVETMPSTREEGDTIIIPVVEEILVIERRLFLKEEVRVRRLRTTERHQETVTLRHQEAVITRLPAEPARDGPEAAPAPGNSNLNPGGSA
jgi:uncharacterized protein (TIGR02271 family)